MAPSIVPSYAQISTLCLILLVSCPLLSAFSLVETGSTLYLDSIPYYIPAAPFTTINSVPLKKYHTKQSSDGLLPVTVVSVKKDGFGIKELGDVVSDFAKDDVWGKGFLGAVLIQYASIYQSPRITSSHPLTLISNSTSTIITISSSPSEIPPGPYFISPSGSLYQPLRLYSDFSGAFTQPLIPGPDSSYIALPASISGISQTVGVPSHLYYTRTASKPLAGVRLGIKDIYDLKGQRTSDGNRAYYALFPPRTVTAPAVQRLIDAGAIIVGKMKTSQFANGETATADWVDYHSPFNPRGDGYQDPSSSSSGGGSGEGSYPWLDLALGSDTGGSIRGPAQLQGVYGNRPSHGLVELTNVMPLAPELDTPGFLCRDADIWAAAGKVLYAGSLRPYTSFPKKLLVTDFPNSPNSTENAILLKFLSQLEKFLDVKGTPFNLESSWAASKPDAALPPLTVFFNTTYPTLISKEQTKNVRDPFYKAYGAVHDGRTPFVDPVPLLRWAYGDSLPASALTEAVSNKTIFMNWWSANILKNDSSTCSDSLLVYFVPVQTHYRNQYTPKPTPPFGFDNTQISIFSEDPDMVVTLGSSPYNSTITNHEEVLPVSINFMAAKGCDAVIFDLVNALQKKGIVTNPKAGGTITGTEVLLRRDF